MFDKYARAIADPAERKRLHRLYLARNICFALCLACVAAIVVLGILMFAAPDLGIFILAMLTIYLLTHAVFVFGIVTVVTWASFSSAWRRVLRGTVPETPEETAYRDAVARDRKSARWALWTMVGCIVVFQMLFTADISRERYDGFGKYGYIGLAFLAVGVAVYAVTTAVYAAKRRKKGIRKPPRSPGGQVPTATGEPEDVAAYRKQFVQDRKATHWAMWVMIGSLIAMVVCIVIDTRRMGDSDKFGAFGYAGIAVAVVGVLTYFAATFVHSMRKSQAAGNATAQTPGTQTEPGKYRLETDAAASSYRYTFPDPELRAKAEAVKLAYGKALTMAILISIFACIAVVFAVFSDLFFHFGIRGYAAAFVQGTVVAASILATTPARIKLNALEKEQRIAIENDGKYIVEREIYRRYDAFVRSYGRALLIGFALCFVVALVLGILYPNSLWSVATFVPLLLFVGMYNRGFRTLRQGVIPLERQIDADAARAAQAQESEEEPVSETEQTPQDTPPEE